MDLAIKDFTEGKLEKKVVLATLVRSLYEVNVTCRIDGTRGTVNLFLQADTPGVDSGTGAANSAGAPDWRADAVCDSLVIHRRCPEHSKGECQFNHDESKAAAIRSDAVARERVKTRLERREQVRRE